MEMERENRTEQEEQGHEVRLANNNGNSLHTESDLIDHVDVGAAVEDLLIESNEDYSHFTKEQFAELIKEVSKDDNFKNADTVIRKIKPLYDDIRGKEKSDALARFITNNGAHAAAARDCSADFDRLARIIADKAGIPWPH